MSVELEQEEFKRALEAKRNEAFLQKLQSISVGDEKLLSALQEQTTILKEYTELVEEAIKMPNNNKETPVIMELVKKLLITTKQLNDTASTKKEWEFQVNRDIEGFIESVTAKQIK